MGCTKCGKSKCCCPKTIRGKMGLTGQRGAKGATGATGATGPQGPAGTLNGTQVTFSPEQTINKGALTPITGATASMAAGTYIVWAEFDIWNEAEDTDATYGLYLDGVLQNATRLVGTTEISGFVIHQYHKCAVNGIITVVGTQTLTIQVQCLEGALSPKSGSIIYQKIS